MACRTLVQPRAALSAPRHNAAASFSSGSSVALRKPSIRLQLRVRASAGPAAAEVAAPLNTLRQACRTKQVPPEEVIAAMEQLEAAHTKSSLVSGGAVGH